MLKAPGSRKMPYLISNDDDVVVAARSLPAARIAPIFQVPSVDREFCVEIKGSASALVTLIFALIGVECDWRVAGFVKEVFESVTTAEGVG